MQGNEDCTINIDDPKVDQSTSSGNENTTTIDVDRENDVGCFCSKSECSAKFSTLCGDTDQIFHGIVILVVRPRLYPCCQ